MNLASAYAAISALSILTVDNGTELCIDFYRFKIMSTTAKATRHTHCPDNSTVQEDVAGYKLDDRMNFTKHHIVPQNTEVGTVLHAGEYTGLTRTAFTLLSTGRDPTFLKNVETPKGGFEVSTSNGHVFYQECRDGGKDRYSPISDPSFETLNRNVLLVCGLTFGHTPDGLIWEGQGKCRKLVVKGKTASLKPEACPKVEKLVFSMTALKNRAASTKGELPDAEVNTTLAVLYLRPKPVTTTTTLEPTTGVAQTTVSETTTEGSDSFSLLLDPRIIVIVSCVVVVFIVVLVGLVVVCKKRYKTTQMESGEPVVEEYAYIYLPELVFNGEHRSPDVLNCFKVDLKYTQEDPSVLV